MNLNIDRFYSSYEDGVDYEVLVNNAMDVIDRGISNGRCGSNHPVLISQHIGSTGIWLGKAEIVVTTLDKWHQ